MARATEGRGSQDWDEGAPSTILTEAIFASFVVTGAALGSRLSAICPAQLLAVAGAGALLITTTMAMSLAFAALASFLTRLPMSQVWIAYAPGGVEAMAAIGLALGYDPAYIAIHHFARILILVILMPVLLARRLWQLCLSAGLRPPCLAGFEDRVCDGDEPACNGNEDNLMRLSSLFQSLCQWL